MEAKLALLCVWVSAPWRGKCLSKFLHPLLSICLSGFSQVLPLSGQLRHNYAFEHLFGFKA